MTRLRRGTRPGPSRTREQGGPAEKDIISFSPAPQCPAATCVWSVTNEMTPHQDSSQRTGDSHRRAELRQLVVGQGEVRLQRVRALQGGARSQMQDRGGMDSEMHRVVSAARLLPAFRGLETVNCDCRSLDLPGPPDVLGGWACMS